MSKLKVMKYNRIMMAIWGIYPRSFASPSLKWLQLFSPYLVTITLIISNTLAATYAYQQAQLSLILEALVLVIGGTETLFGYLNMKWKMDRVVEVNSKLQEIVNQG